MYSLTNKSKIQSTQSYLAEYKPEVNPLWVSCVSQLRQAGHEDGRHHEHCGQVNTKSSLKVLRLEESGQVGGEHEEDGGKIGRDHLPPELPPQDHNHPDALFRTVRAPLCQLPVNDVEEWQVDRIQLGIIAGAQPHVHPVRIQHHCLQVQASHCHLYCTHLGEVVSFLYQ